MYQLPIITYNYTVVHLFCSVSVILKFCYRYLISESKSSVTKILAKTENVEMTTGADPFCATMGEEAGGIHSGDRDVQKTNHLPGQPVDGQALPSRPDVGHDEGGGLEEVRLQMCDGREGLSRPRTVADNHSVASLGSFCQDSSSSRSLSHTTASSSSLLGLAPRIEDFEILKPISRGAFGKVFLCHRKDNPDRKLAVKVLKKHEVIEKNLVSQVIAERNALAITKSPFCVNLFYCLQTHNNVFLVSFRYVRYLC